MTAFQPADYGQEQLSDAEPATQLLFAAQAQPEQPDASKSQEAVDATDTLADRTADTAASGGGGRYQAVPPSSLWGPPVGVGVTTSLAAGVEAKAGQRAAGDDRTAEANLVNAGDDALVSAAYPARDDQTGYGGPSNRPATHTGFASGMHFA